MDSRFSEICFEAFKLLSCELFMFACKWNELKLKLKVKQRSWATRLSLVCSAPEGVSVSDADSSELLCFLNRGSTSETHWRIWASVCWPHVISVLFLMQRTRRSGTQPGDGGQRSNSALRLQHCVSVSSKWK